MAVDETFACANCARVVPFGGRTARNHCPWCLHSLHVDVVPGDRAADCGGLLVPVGAKYAHGQWTLRHRCAVCGAERRVRALEDAEVPDDPAALRGVASRG
ncbi:MAG: RNHCP domain-containing protein [Proteobacteria bacterium]|nr:RNHCP domain-containing protein [Pseudomonadota bacterium]